MTGQNTFARKKICRFTDLLSVKLNGRTYNSCYSCWLNKHTSKENIREQFAEVGGYVDGRDPPMEHTKKLFKLLGKRVSVKEATRMAFDP